MLKWLNQWRAWGRIDEGAVHAGRDEESLRLHRALESGAADQSEREGEASGRMRARVEASIRAGSAKRFNDGPVARGWSASLGWTAALAAVVVIAGVSAVVLLGPGAPGGERSAKETAPTQRSVLTFEDYMRPRIAVESANRLEQRLARESAALAADVRRLASGVRSRMPAGFGDAGVRGR